MIIINVRWDNPAHALLQEGTLGLLVNKVPFKAKTSKPGFKEFVLTDDVIANLSTLALQGGFRLDADEVRLPWEVDPVAPFSAHVLDVHQDYKLVKNNTELEPIPSAPFTGPHPLVTTSHVASSKTPVVEIHVNTQFVDVTPFWAKYAAWSEEFETDRPKSVDFIAMAYTGQPGRDWIWFAGIPTAAKTAANPSCFVYYMYQGRLYTKIVQEHDMFEVNRHLLSPTPTSMEDHARDVFTPKPVIWKSYWYLRAGFLQALEDSGKKVVLLYPLPDAPTDPKGTAYGPGTSNKLPEMVGAAFRFLHALQKIGRGSDSIARRRLALGGYSAGGFGMWQSMINNFVHVDELYSFDAQATPGKLLFVQQWITQRRNQKSLPSPDVRLRLTGSLQMDANTAIFDAVAPVLGPGKCSISPPRGQEQSFWTASGNPWWNAMLTKFPSGSVELAEARADGTARHQFALQGGSTTAAAGGYLLEFLRRSDL